MSLRLVLLALLSKEPNTGYGLGRLLERELSHLWTARLQQIYSELARLQADGLIEAERIELTNRPAKKRYTLTRPGHAALDSLLAEDPANSHHKDELTAQLLCLERIAPSTLLRRIEARLEERRRELLDLRGRQDEAARAKPADLGLLLTLGRAVSAAEAETAWCVSALDALRAAVDEQSPATAWSEQGLRSAAERAV